MSLLTKLFTEVADDIPREAACPAWGHGLRRTHSPMALPSMMRKYTFFILTEKGLNSLYDLGLSLNSFPFKCLWGNS